MIRLIYYTFVAHSTPIQLALYVKPPIVGGLFYTRWGVLLLLSVVIISKSNISFYIGYNLDRFCPFKKYIYMSAYL